MPYYRTFRSRSLLNLNTIQVDLGNARLKSRTVIRLWSTGRENHTFMLSGCPIADIAHAELKGIFVTSPARIIDRRELSLFEKLVQGPSLWRKGPTWLVRNLCILDQKQTLVMEKCIQLPRLQLLIIWYKAI